MIWFNQNFKKYIYAEIYSLKNTCLLRSLILHSKRGFFKIFCLIDSFFSLQANIFKFQNLKKLILCANSYQYVLWNFWAIFASRSFINRKFLKRQISWTWRYKNVIKFIICCEYRGCHKEWENVWRTVKIKRLNITEWIFF